MAAPADSATQSPGPARPQAGALSRQLFLLAAAFAAGTALAAAAGAVNFGTALAIGQLAFAAALVWVLLSG